MAAPDNVTVNHWGIWVTSNQPVTGVLNISSAPQGLFDDLDDAIPLACETCAARDQEGACDFCESSGPLLAGNWYEDAAGLWRPDPDGEYAAIVQEDVIQVVFSQHTAHGALCSPCYPGQVDLDTPGDFLGYCLPPDMDY